jgi:S1-C subfamily serine protease
VVAGARDIKVTLANGQDFPAKQVGVDTENDIAIVKIEATGLPVAVIGDSGNLVVGQLVVAIGSPLGFEQTVTSGIISALHRTVSESDQTGAPTITLTDMIQTDASINPGNSGGALCDSNARVIGINTLIASQSGGSQGIGFAIPVNAIKPVANNIIAGTPVPHPFIGVVGQTVDSAVAAQFKLATSRGAYITDVVANSPAQKAGLKPGDIVVSADGRRVSSMSDLYGYVHQHDVGYRMPLIYYRDGKRQTATLVVGDRPPNAPSQ